MYLTCQTTYTQQIDLVYAGGMELAQDVILILKIAIFRKRYVGKLIDRGPMR